MKQGDCVKLRIKKVLSKETSLDANEYVCSVLAYDMNAECIYLILKNAKLTDILLDAIYECQIEDEKYWKKSMGRVQQRYKNAYGNILEFRVKDGFYKINIK